MSQRPLEEAQRTDEEQFGNHRNQRQRNLPRNPFQIQRDDDDALSDEDDYEEYGDAAEQVRFLEPASHHPTRATAADATSCAAPRHLLRVALALSAMGALVAWATGGAGGWRAAPFLGLGGHRNSDKPKVASELVPLQALNRTFYFTETQMAQIQNYRRNNALLLHIHLTHHGGTTFCTAVGKTHGRSPNFACRIDRHHEELPLNLTLDQRFNDGRNPWYANETDDKIDLLRPYYHMVSWEYGIRAPEPRFQVTDWENPRLASVIVMRDPISRLLAGDGYVNHKYNIHSPNATRDDWWDYANTTHGDTNNVMLHDLSADPTCCQGANTPVERLREAQELIQRFTFVLDLACLDEGMRALLAVLQLDEDYNPIQTNRRNPKDHSHPPPSDRIPYPEVYQFLRERNRLDQELYEWSQNISLVRCADLEHP